ncbi:hypothetical protein JRQ81_010382 [Phrynocephalus forsythii]|uniref:NACHT domain-containing protein n=1 Tax=Phrynocephalus forsythii TaxID=171643 RepID=A0A9Q0X8D3_9SAUR|nr:hypothetical protein JRQ81_010382 [Phrynocephalus forsythii]
MCVSIRVFTYGAIQRNATVEAAGMDLPREICPQIHDIHANAPASQIEAFLGVVLEEGTLSKEYYQRLGPCRLPNLGSCQEDATAVASPGRKDKSGLAQSSTVPGTMAGCNPGLSILQVSQTGPLDQMLQDNAMEAGGLMGRSYLELLQSDVDESVLYMQVEEATEISAASPSADTFGDLDVFYTVEGEEVRPCSNTGEAYDKIAALAEYLLKDQQEPPVEEIFGNCSDGPEAKRRKVVAHTPALCIMDGDSVCIVPNDVTAQCDVQVEFSVATVGPLGRAPKAFGPSAGPVPQLYLSGMKGIQVILTVEPPSPLAPPPVPGPGGALENICPAGEDAPRKGPQRPPLPSKQTRKRPESVEAFHTQLKSHFRETCGFAPLGREIPLDSLYIDCDLVQCHPEGKSGRNADPRTFDLREKTAVRGSQLLDRPGRNGGGTCVIVVSGKAGMGKSLLTWKICLDWSNDRLPGFDFVFRFDCRDIHSAVEDHDSLKRLLLEPSPGPQGDTEEVFQYLLQNPRRVLLIFDGFEDLKAPGGFPPPLRQPASPGAVQDRSHLVRPLPEKERLHLYLPRTDTILEVVGFSAQQAKRYLAQYFQGCPFSDEAVNSIRNSPYLFSHCCHPSLCQFICEAVLTTGPRDLPATLTGLLVKSLLHQLNLASKKGAPLNYRNLEALARMAWQLGGNQPTVFTGHHFPSEEVQTFALDSGLVVRLPKSCSDRKGECEYAFPSVVLHNFLLALHLVLSPEVKDKKLTKHLCLLCNKSKKCLSAWELVPRFLSGLLFLAGDLRSSFLFGEEGEHETEKMITKKRKSLSKYIRKLSIQDFSPDKLLELLHCVHEMDDPYLQRHLALHLQTNLSFQGLSLCPPDVCVLHSTLRRSSKEFSLDLRGSTLDPGGLKQLVMGENVSTFRASLSDTVQLWKDLWESKAEEQLWAAVEKVAVDPFKAETMKDVEDLLLLVRLQEDMTQGQPDIIGCKNSRIPAVADLQQLEFTLGPACGFQGFQKLARILDAFPALQHLDLDSPDENEIGDEGVALLSKVLPHLPALETLNLSRNKVTDAGAETLAKGLPSLPLLKTLSLYNNNIGDAGAEHLAKILPQVASLRVLDIQCNKITAGGAQHFTESLQRCPHIQRVRLWNARIPHRVLDRLQQLDPRIRLL